MLRQVNHADGLPWTHLTCSAGIALGCLSDAVSTSNWQHWCLSRYTAAHAPSYLSEACKSAPEASLHRHLHSSAAITCITPWSTTRLGDRSFDVTVTRTVVSLRRVQISAWGQSASPSPLVCCHHMHHTVVQNSSGRQVVWCHRNAHRRISQTRANQRLRPVCVAISTRLLPSRFFRPWSRTRLSDRSFDVTVTQLWNKLPASLQSSDSLCQFRRQLKTFLFVKD